jgi:DNA-binding NarL/FixJ family response regulator
VRFAFENPNRVRALILVHSAASLAAYPIPLWLNVARENWEFFLQTIATGQTAHAKHNAVERYRQMTTQADWLATVQAFGQSDISSLLSAIKAPTLVLHAREFPQLKIEEATRLAAQIHGARLYVSDGGGTFTNLDQSLPAIESFLESLTDDAPPSVPQGDHVSLSPREVEVLRLLGAGRTNQQIADELVISLNTVRRHVSNLFAKTGVVNRAQAAVYARTRGLV